jgi:hypothetical protein
MVALDVRLTVELHVEAKYSTFHFLKGVNTDGRLEHGSDAWRFIGNLRAHYYVSISLLRIMINSMGAGG